MVGAEKVNDHLPIIDLIGARPSPLRPLHSRYSKTGWIAHISIR